MSDEAKAGPATIDPTAGDEMFGSEPPPLGADPEKAEGHEKKVPENSGAASGRGGQGDKSEPPGVENKALKRWVRKSFRWAHKANPDVVAEPEDGPSMDDLVALQRGDKSCEMVRVGEVAIFLEEPEDEVLHAIWTMAPKRNVVNRCAPVTADRACEVGAGILSDGFQTNRCEVAWVEGQKGLQCVSGRHRLSWYLAVFGPDIEVPMHVKHGVSLEKALVLVTRANDCRKTGKAEDAANQWTQKAHGRDDCGPSDIYATCTSWRDVEKLLIEALRQSAWAGKMDFKCGHVKRVTAKNGLDTNVVSLCKFWKHATFWDAEQSYRDFHTAVRESLSWLNDLYAGLCEREDYVPSKHLGSTAMDGLGRWYNAQRAAARQEPDAGSIVDLLVEAVAKRPKNGLALYNYLARH